MSHSFGNHTILVELYVFDSLKKEPSHMNNSFRNQTTLVELYL